MIVKEIHKRIMTLITLGLFLLSTSGLVFFYHYCIHAHELVYSVFIDSTEDICEENAIINHDHFHHNDQCCHAEETSDHDCCDNHHSSNKIVKLTSAFQFSERQQTPKPILVSLLQQETILQLDYFHALLLEKDFSGEIPPEKPLINTNGRQIITKHHTLKIAC